MPECAGVSFPAKRHLIHDKLSFLLLLTLCSYRAIHHPPPPFASFPFVTSFLAGQRRLSSQGTIQLRCSDSGPPAPAAHSYLFP
ncbi:uncharacterized protein BDW43DRAFT_224841 [Aspergillus alliaceus]|uniref:uncharacterized protein n=1 Tax=Petromyces alliaceus TaxID=209559 RepID=UPI0012A6628B|nr:uncharacterized protein BDW43DRAFT_224841 [Aspergillus alliaceus]KAB8236782.1 hypothetical protein BDW43DRAFT_224841 [Aspergillus alliaceus]